MKIFILTQYYLPETGAPQNRLSSLAEHLQSFGAAVDVMTALPNYPKQEIYPGYQRKSYSFEKINGINVHRSNLFVSKKKGFYYRLANYISFTLNAWRNARKKILPPDIILCESPPLFLGITAIFLKRKWKCRLVFNVSDLWPESAEKMGIIKNKWILQRSYKLAQWIYKNSDLISGQTQGILEAIDQMIPGKKLYWFPNGVDDIFFLTAPKNICKVEENGFHLLYAGILGHAQGLEVILHAARILQDKADIHFTIIGDGPEKERLLHLKETLSLQNVTFKPNMPRDFVLSEIESCDAYIVPLRKLDLFKGAIPSKLFEPLAFGKPILLGVDGEARTLFINEGKTGIYFEPENADALACAIMELYLNPDLKRTLGNQGKTYVLNNFERSKIAEKFYLQLQALI
ncbi:MAG: glycosyltransferase family 4 protein [Bacteroidetes bacterium]|nr:glycosyltransferase family 4 protein [Bacteroidota bacterium]